MVQLGVRISIPDRIDPRFRGGRQFSKPNLANGFVTFGAKRKGLSRAKYNRHKATDRDSWFSSSWHFNALRKLDAIAYAIASVTVRLRIS